MKSHFSLRFTGQPSVPLVNMDEQRQEAYLKLIQALLSYPSGEESQILNAHSDLIDEGLLEVITSYEL